MTCAINDDLLPKDDCNVYLENGGVDLPASQCTVDIVFNYTFTNVGLGCFDIVSVKSKLGPLDSEGVTVEFDDVYSYRERQICVHETWTIPDRRSAVNLCNETKDFPTWDIALNVDEFNGRTTNLASSYNWTLYQSPAPSFIPPPSVSPSTYPSQSPSTDICTDCTLTSILSGGKYKERMIIHCQSMLILSLRTFLSRMRFLFFSFFNSSYFHCSTLISWRQTPMFPFIFHSSTIKPPL